MKKMLFLVLVLLLLAVAGLGGAGHFGKGPLAPYLYKAPAETALPPAPPHRIFYLGEVITPIIRNHAIEQQIGMDIDIDVFAAGYDKVTSVVQLIDHRVRMEMFDFLPKHSNTDSDADKQAVHDRIQWIVESTVGPGVVREVTLRTFYSR
jgi:hypothetical protein